MTHHDSFESVMNEVNSCSCDENKQREGGLWIEASSHNDMASKIM